MNETDNVAVAKARARALLRMFRVVSGPLPSLYAASTRTGPVPAAGYQKPRGTALADLDVPLDEDDTA